MSANPESEKLNLICQNLYSLKNACILHSLQIDIQLLNPFKIMLIIVFSIASPAPDFVPFYGLKFRNTIFRKMRQFFSPKNGTKSDSINIHALYAQFFSSVACYEGHILFFTCVSNRFQLVVFCMWCIVEPCSAKVGAIWLIWQKYHNRWIRRPKKNACGGVFSCTSKTIELWER